MNGHSHSHRSVEQPADRVPDAEKGEHPRPTRGQGLQSADRLARVVPQESEEGECASVAETLPEPWG